MSKTLVDTGHTGHVLDLAVDGTGQIAATCGEDSTIQLVAVREGKAATGSRTIATLQGHQSPALCVAWNGNGELLASCDESGGLIIWHDPSRQHKQWTIAFRQLLQAVPTALSWAPMEHGPQLAVALSSGKVLVLAAAGAQRWDISSEMEAHNGVVCGVSWSPFLAPGGLSALPLTPAQGSVSAAAPQRLVTAGLDGTVRVWQYAPADRHWRREELHVEGQQAPSRLQWSCVSWAGNVGMPFTYVAAGALEGSVVVWRQDGVDGRWHCVALPPVFEEAITKVSWSAVGTLLLVSCANGASTTWKESVTGEWEMLASMR